MDGSVVTDAVCRMASGPEPIRSNRKIVHQHGEDSDDGVVEGTKTLTFGFVNGGVRTVIADDALRSDLVDPGDDQCRDQPDGDQDNDEGYRPVGQPDVWKRGLCNLDQRPCADRVSERYSMDIAALELAEKSVPGVLQAFDLCGGAGRNRILCNNGSYKVR